MKIEKLEEVIEIVSAANEEEKKLRNRDIPDSVAEIRIGAGIARAHFDLLRANAVSSLVDAGFEVDIFNGAGVYWSEEEQGE